MARVSHLIRRNGIYWFKIDLPSDLTGLPLPLSMPHTIKRLESPTRLGRFKTAIWLSLKTTEEREAKQRVGIRIAEYAILFDVARAFLTGSEPRPDEVIALYGSDPLPATQGYVDC